MREGHRVLDPRPTAAPVPLAARPGTRARRLVLFDNGKLGPPYGRWMPALGPLHAMLAELGEVTLERSDLLMDDPESHRLRVDDWGERGIDGVVFGLCDAGVTQPTILLAAAAEAAGIPTAVLCIEPVIELAAVAASFRAPGLPLVTLEADRLAGPEAIAAAARACRDAVVQALTRPPADHEARFAQRFPFTRGLGQADAGVRAEDFAAFARENRMGDGLPLVPPGEFLVQRFVEVGGRPADAVLIEQLQPSGAPLTVKQAAICAAMAGCEPSSFPIVLAMLEAIGAPEYRLHLASITTHPGGNLVVVSGAAATAAGMHSGRGCLGPGHHVNATIGRTLSLILINVARAIPGLSALSLLASPAQFSCCLADRSDGPYPSLAATLGAGERSIVWAQKCEVHDVLDHLSEAPEALLTTFCRVAATVGGNNAYLPSDLMLILNPEHAALLARRGWSREDIGAFVFATARNLRSEVVGRGVKGEWPEQWSDWDSVPVVPGPDRVWTVVAGAPGPHSAVTVPWGYGAATWRPIIAPGATEVDRHDSDRRVSA